MLLGLAVSDVDVGVLNMGVKCISSFFLMFPVSRNVYSLMNAIIGVIGLILLFYIQGSFGMFRPENLQSNLNFERYSHSPMFSQRHVAFRCIPT